MRRLPVYLLIDCSESMAGEAIVAVQTGLGSLLGALRSDPYALETSFLSVITFSNFAKQMVPLTELIQFQLPSLVMGSGTALGSALNMLEDCLANEVVKSTPERKGDYKPICFILTDGDPTDSWQAQADRFKKNISGRKAFVIAVACGPDASPGKLKHITDDVLLAKDLDAETFKKLFKWVSASVSTASQSIETVGNPTINLDKLPDGCIEKASENDLTREADADRFLFLHAKCVKHKSFYILRFQREKGLFESKQIYKGVAAHKVEAFDFSTHQGGKADFKISVEKLINSPPCPYCGNGLWAMCVCGEVHCFPDNAKDGTKLNCPWCGKTNIYSRGSFDVGRGIG